MNFLPSWPPEINTLLLFGLLLFGGALGGYFAHRLRWLPSITGFMAVGLAVGPQGLGLIGPEGMAQAKVIVDVALALILYRLGLSLDLKALLADRRLLLVSLAEGVATFVLIYAALALVGVSGVVAAVIATIGISSSPAVLIHVGHELGASGPVTERARALVALNNMMAFVAFSAVLPVLYQHNDAGWAVTLGAPAWRLLGSAALGLVWRPFWALLGLALALYSAANAVASFSVGRGDGPRLLVIHPILHLSYGLGFLVGLVHFANRFAAPRERPQASHT